MVFPLEDLKTATNNFSADDLIGEGGLGKIYKGRLRYLDVALCDVSLIEMVAPIL